MKLTNNLLNNQNYIFGNEDKNFIMKGFGESILDNLGQIKRFINYSFRMGHNGKSRLEENRLSRKNIFLIFLSKYFNGTDRKMYQNVYLLKTKVDPNIKLIPMFSEDYYGLFSNKTYCLIDTTKIKL